MALPLVKLIAGYKKDFCETAVGCLGKSLDQLSNKLEAVHDSLNNLFYLFVVIGVLNVLFILVVVFIVLLALKTWRREQEIVSREWPEKKIDPKTWENLLPYNSSKLAIENIMMT